MTLLNLFQQLTVCMGSLSINISVSDVCFAFSECLVDLMGAPGTLIPADILSITDTSFSSYPPNLSKIPSLQTTYDSGLVYPILKPFLGEFEGSSQRSGVENSLPLGKRSSSEMTETFPSLPSAQSSGVGSSGTSKATPAKQLDHVPSLAIGPSLRKGGRGPNAASDGSRMNVNIVPYTQAGSEESKNLFADLNPFQIKGSGKATVQNNVAWNKSEEFRRPKNDLVSGRPPVPLLWKNRQPCNEEPFPRNNCEANDYNMSSAASTSSATSDKVYPDNLKLQNHPYPNGDTNSSIGGNSLLSPNESQFNGSSLEDNLGTNRKQEYHSEYGKNTIGVHDRRKGTPGTNLKLKDPESLSSSVNSRSFQVDPVMDDVGECEIPWEDLVIGERIGLGKYHLQLLFYRPCKMVCL